MRHARPLIPASALAALLWLSPVAIAFAQKSDPTPAVAALHESFAHPPDDCRIMMRWWWFGPAATNPELQSELEQMKAAGIGEIKGDVAINVPFSSLEDYTAARADVAAVAVAIQQGH